MHKALSDLVDINPQVDLPPGLNSLSPVSFVPMADVTEGGEWIGRQVRQLQEVKSGFTSFANNDVLVAKITPCFENGKGALASGLVNGIGFGSTEFHVLRARENVHSGFVFHVTQSTGFRFLAERYMTGSAGQKRVAREAFDAFQLPELSPDEQRAISTVLDTLDTTIRQTEAIIEKLKQVKQGLLHDLLTRGIDSNGELRPPQSDAAELYKDSPVGWIPRSWRAGNLASLAEVVRGKFTHRPRNDPAFFGGPHPFIQTGDVAAAEGRLVFEYSQTLSERGVGVSQEFPARTIAVTIAANIADTAILGMPMYFPDSVVGVIVQATANVRFVELSIRKARPRLEARAPQSAQKNINLQDLRPLLLAIPPREEQDEIAARYEALERQMADELACAKKLRHLKSGLMDDLLTGRVRVTPLLANAAT